jgi:two-component system response regulator FlrC
MIGLSARLIAANPSLVGWLEGAGIEAAPANPGADAGAMPCLLDASERSAARPCDILIDRTAASPSLTFSDGVAPTLLRFGTDDTAFGNALAAELVRPLARPACGDPASAALLDLVERVAATDITVLVLGETGTGKEGIARFIHQTSPRAARPFVAVNCAALPETMLEAMLFGHRKGSFTGASSDGEGLFRAANGGTLLLDEVAEMPIALQAKLLRALQEKEVLPVGAVRAEPIDVRVIACANRDLAVEVSEGRFRSDLYWRLNVMPVRLQPLRARRLDIPAIAAAMILRHTPVGAPVAWPTRAAVERLARHSWPGNARELDNVLQRALLLRTGERVEVADLHIEADPAAQPVREVIRLADAGRSAEENVIRAALAATGGHRLRAAERLGISERTLRYRLAGMCAVAA